MRMIWWALLPVTAVAVVASATASHVSGSPEPVFHKVDWALPIDPWGPGQAFVCEAGPGCATPVRLYARTKSGFCNCYGGVADDTEIDRIGDVDLHGDDFKGLDPGVVTSLAGLAGRARRFDVIAGPGNTRRVLSIVVASDCKAVVATLVSDADITGSAEQAARRILGEAPFQTWAAAQ